jgi:hypothetical protein
LQKDIGPKQPGDVSGVPQNIHNGLDCLDDAIFRTLCTNILVVVDMLLA